MSNRAKLAYNIFRGGFRDPGAIPHWDDVASWVRDVVTVAYLQGKLDGQAPFFECPECGKDIADEDEPHKPDCPKASTSASTECNPSEIVEGSQS
jgi:hypothetical protein